MQKSTFAVAKTRQKSRSLGERQQCAACYGAKSKLAYWAENHPWQAQAALSEMDSRKNRSISVRGITLLRTASEARSFPRFKSR